MALGAMPHSPACVCSLPACSPLARSLTHSFITSQKLAENQLVPGLPRTTCLPVLHSAVRPKEGFGPEQEMGVREVFSGIQTSCPFYVKK